MLTLAGATAAFFRSIAMLTVVVYGVWQVTAEEELLPRKAAGAYEARCLRSAKTQSPVTSSVLLWDVPRWYHLGWYLNPFILLSAWLSRLFALGLVMVNVPMTLYEVHVACY